MSEQLPAPHAIGRRVAVIGMAGRFPGAADVDAFWGNLIEGVESLTELSADQLRGSGVPQARIDNPDYVKLVPVLDDIEGFDAKFFGYNAREAQIADPQQRVFLEVCHTALQHAGYDPARYPGDVGVFGGGAPNSYGERYVYENDKVRATVGDVAIEINNAADYLATRVAFALGLTGPAVSVATACSTALVAVHLACRSLADGECSMAIAGGVNIRVPQNRGHLWAENSLYSRDGHIRAFDAAAAGTNFGHGAGAVVLKRYEDAMADGDTVHAVLIGSAINNDGAKRSSFSAPGAAGQTEVIRRALHAANVPPDSIGYIEAHGTGTAIGDPIEVSALSAAFRQAGCTASQSIPIGSVKTNIGHLGAAAGAAGLIKTVLAMRHGQLPGTLHFEKPNPRIDFAETPFHVAKRRRPWPKTDGPLRAGVSSFGIGGTNAHIVVEQAPDPEPTDPGRTWQVLPLSARSESALATMREQVAAHLERQPGPALADVAYTLQVGRPELAYRTYAVCRDYGTAVAALGAGEAVCVDPRRSTPVVFMFPGQGTQYPDMGADLYANEPVFRAALDECARLAEPHLGHDLREAILSSFGENADPVAMAERLRQTGLTQPALFAVEYALARLWLSRGVEPAAMVGHSIGELVAACLAEVFDLPAAVELVAARGRLTQSMPAGAMLALPLAEADVTAVLSDKIDLAAVNAPQATVVAGPAEALEALNALLAPTGVTGTMLQTSHAFHSAMLDPVVEPMREIAERAGLRAPKRRFISTVTGDWITDEQATDPGYWARQLREPVRFAPAVALAAGLGAVLLEVGPGRTLSSMAKQTVGKQVRTALSLARPDSGMTDGQVIAQAVGTLWAAGSRIDWPALHAGDRRRHVPLPTYPYERSRFWLDPDPDARPVPAPEPAAAQPAGAQGDSITFLPTWRQQRLSPAAAPGAGTGPWLVFTPGDNGLIDEAADELSRRGRAVVRVSAGEGFADLGHGHFQIRPAHRPDYDELLKALEAGAGRPTHVLHGWTAGSVPSGQHPQATVDTVRDQGFYSLVYLSQAFTTRWPTDEVSIRIGTTHSADVSGADRVEPAKALLVGPCLVLPIEANQLDCQLIDLSEHTGVDQLLAELSAPITDRRVAYRRGRRWVADHEPAVLPEPTTLPRTLRRRGVYLVTGGLGALGMRVAQELARTVGARLVLTARTALPDRSDWDAHLEAHAGDRVSAAIRGVRALEGLGAEVLVAAADVSDEVAMRAAVEAARERFGRVDGVFHAAGVAGGGLVSMKSREQADSVLRPKVDGTLVLDRLLGDEIDLFVLFSSILAVTGGYGQVDYAAANAFMDAFALSRAGGRVHTLTVNWCGWEGIGMLAGEIKPADASAGSGDHADAADGGGAESEVRLGEKGPGLLGRRVLDTEDVVFLARIASDSHWVLTDHRMGDRAVFPGTSYVEMISAAGREAFGGGPIELRDLIFSRPLAIDGPRELRVAGTASASGGYQFTVTSRPSETPGAAWERHASARVAAVPHTAADEPPPQNVDAIAQRCDILSWKPDLTDPDGVVAFGPRWQVVEAVRLGRGEQLARLALPIGLGEDLAQYLLHPSLLDGATALSLYMPDVVRGGRSYLPIAYDRVIVRRPLPERFYSHIRNREGGDRTGAAGIMTFDVDLLDDDGRELVAIEGFSVRTVDVESVHAALDSGPAEGARTAKPALGLAEEELLLDPERGLDLLWRMLDSRAEPQYVVTVESIRDKTRRLAGLAARVAAVLEAAGGGRFADAAKRAPRARVADSGPTTATEAALLPLWEDAFAVTQLGLDEDFFDLGGNSLVAVQLAVRIREHFGVNVPGIAVLEYPTVRTLAQFVDEALVEA